METSKLFILYFCLEIITRVHEIIKGLFFFSEDTEFMKIKDNTWKASCFILKSLSTENNSIRATHSINVLNLYTYILIYIYLGYV